MEKKEIDRELSAIFAIFKEITGMESSPRRDGSVLMPYILDHNFKLYDFRIIIEHHWADSREREYLVRPGNLNLRTIFNTSRMERILDVHQGLVWHHQQSHKKLKEAEALSPNMRIVVIILPNGRRFERILVKSGKSWAVEERNKADYENICGDIWAAEYEKKFGQSVLA